MKNKNWISWNLIYFSTCFLSFIICGNTAQADKVCLKSSMKAGTSKVTMTRRVVSTGACPRGFLQVVDTSTLTGPTGATGANGTDGTNGSNGTNGTNGVDGQLRIYGNGSAGALSVPSTGTLFTNYATNGNYQFTNVTISSGATLTVQSGTIIRCTGTFLNQGTISVETGALGGHNRTAFSSDILYPAMAPAVAGISLSIPMAGELGGGTNTRFGGNGAQGLTSARARAILHPGNLGGGGGATVNSGSSGGGAGGGSFIVLAETAISNEGTITADGLAGDVGAGGGGGGVVILASPSSISQTGTINARGGAGGGSSSYNGNGGGGGGGLVHLLSPSITLSGAIALTGGLGNTSATAASNPIRAGGSGGGACAGGGGSGGNVYSSNSVEDGGNGSVGLSITTVADPTSLF